MVLRIVHSTFARVVVHCYANKTHKTQQLQKIFVFSTFFLLRISHFVLPSVKNMKKFAYKTCGITSHCQFRHVRNLSSSRTQFKWNYPTTTNKKWRRKPLKSRWKRSEDIKRIYCVVWDHLGMNIYMLCVDGVLNMKKKIIVESEMMTKGDFL